MARTKRYKVFVSYSRHDEALVKPLAGMLGVAANDAVFLDVNSIKPGALWEKEIIDAIHQSSVFVLCWCCESRQSSFIAREISTALEQGNKRMVPVLFCATPLPPSMADRQWINLTGQVVHHCNHFHEPTASSSRANSGDAPDFGSPSPSHYDVPPNYAAAPAPRMSTSAPRATAPARSSLLAGASAVAGIFIVALFATHLLLKYRYHIEPAVWIALAIVVSIATVIATTRQRLSVSTPPARPMRNTSAAEADLVARKARDYFQSLRRS